MKARELGTANSGSNPTKGEPRRSARRTGGNPTEFAILECAQIIFKITRSSSDMRFEPLPQDDPTRRKPHIRRAGNVLGWKPKVSVREGLKSPWIISETP